MKCFVSLCRSRRGRDLTKGKTSCEEKVIILAVIVGSVALCCCILNILVECLKYCSHHTCLCRQDPLDIELDGFEVLNSLETWRWEIEGTRAMPGLMESTF